LAKVYVLLGIYIFYSSASSFNLDEFSLAHYSIKMSSEPILDSNISQEQNNVTSIMNSKGQRYTCFIPVDHLSEYSEDPVEDITDLDIAKLLKPLETGPCIVAIKDWWTYEVCYKREVKQYHLEGDVASGEVIMLGTYNPDRINKDQNKTFYSQWYDSGSKCDVTGKMRETEVRFVCYEAAIQEVIAEVFEVHSCEYRVIIYSSKICSIKSMRIGGVLGKPKEITCAPVLGQQQMNGYLKYAQMKEKVKVLKKETKTQQEFTQFIREGGLKKYPISPLTPSQQPILFDNLMMQLGDSMMENLLNEATTLLDSTLKEFSTNSISIKQDFSQVETAEDVVDVTTIDDPSLTVKSTVDKYRSMIQQRNEIMARLNELLQTEGQIKSEMLTVGKELSDAKQQHDDVIFKKLELKWKGLSSRARSSRLEIMELESKSATVAKDIMKLKKILKSEKIEDDLLADVKHSEESNVASDEYNTDRSSDGSLSPSSLDSLVKSIEDEFEKLSSKGDESGNIQVITFKQYSEEDNDSKRSNKFLLKLEIRYADN